MPPALFERHFKKCTAKKCTKCEWSKRGPKRRKQSLLPDGKTTWLTAAFTGRGVQQEKFETRMRCMSEVFTKTSCWWLNQSQQQKKPVSAINLRFSTCLWQTYHAIIQTIYTGMVTLRLMCKQCWTGKNQSRPVAVPWLAVRPGSKSSKID